MFAYIAINLIIIEITIKASKYYIKFYLQAIIIFI